jgi:hypothetical protein
MSNAVYDYVKKYRARLDAPNILEGTRLRDLAREFWQETSNEGTALAGPLEKLPEGTLGVQFHLLWRANYPARRFAPDEDLEEKQETLDEIKREADTFLSMMSHVENERGILGMKGMSKEGLSTLPPELQREVEAFLAPGGRTEERSILISKLMAQKGLPGVRSDVRPGRNIPGRGPPPPPPGGAGPAAAGAGGPAGGKRRKTRKGKGKSRKARYSRRR